MIIYKITNKTNGKIYIGYTKYTLRHRVIEHLRSKCGSGVLIHKALLKYGLSGFTYEVIDAAKTESSIKHQEKFWIRLLTCKAPNGYNLTDGGDGVVNPSIRTRDKISSALKGNKNNPNIADYAGCNKGKSMGPRSLESRQKQSQTTKGISRGPLKPETIEKIKVARAKQVFSPEDISLRNKAISEAYYKGSALARYNQRRSK